MLADRFAASGLALAVLLCACGRPADRRQASAAPTPEAVPARADRYGALMVELGIHLQVLGKAGAAGRWALAAHEAKQIGVLFDEDLPAARPPPEAVVEVLLGRGRNFTDVSLPALRAALRAHDPAKFSQAYGAVVAACNGCHVSAGFEFIEIPAEVGAPIPRTD